MVRAMKITSSGRTSSYQYNNLEKSISNNLLILC